jgi:hypothetical protein
MDARKLITRMTTCKIRDHAWVQMSYASTEDDRTGRFLRCQRCGKEAHGGSAVTRVAFL